MRAMNGKRGPDSYFSKILLQINNKLGGFNYYLNTTNDIDEKNIILIGIDSSHKWGKNTSKSNKQIGVAMVATKDKKFSKFYSKEEIMKDDKYRFLNTRKVIYNFIEKAIEKYSKETGKNPKNIIIYRQGFINNQSKFIKLEISYIEKICKKLNVNYYYILVNIRSSIKIFEYNMNRKSIEDNYYKNPDQGLIALDEITNKNRFEFFIQPQKVNSGSATPTYYHVAYGNMEFPEILMQLSYWTTYIYQNWQNAVRIPHVLKMAEKLANMTAQYTRANLNDNLSDTQSFL